MLKKDHINFDILDIQVDTVKTDIVGDVRTATSVFQPCTFASIFCAHVIEHFYAVEAQHLLADCFLLLRPGGLMVLEAPDIEKIILTYEVGQINQVIQEIYGDHQWMAKYGDKWMHKWGWTGKRAADAMQAAGFRIRMIGDGISHHKPFRDFRVEGVKP